MNRAFKGIWIPRQIWLSRELSLQEKVFIVEIESLEENSKGGCYAGNKYFSSFFGISESRVSSIIKDLVNKKMIERNVQRTQNGTVRILKVSHYLKIAIAHSHQIEVRTTQKQDSHSAKSDSRIIHSNNTLINKKKNSKKINANPRLKL